MSYIVSIHHLYCYWWTEDKCLCLLLLLLLIYYNQLEKSIFRNNSEVMMINSPALSSLLPSPFLPQLCFLYFLIYFIFIFNYYLKIIIILKILKILIIYYNITLKKDKTQCVYITLPIHAHHQAPCTSKPATELSLKLRI